MKWAIVRRRIREIWPKIEGLVPERERRSEGRIVYQDRLVFEAMCKMVWADHPMRKPLGHPYPTVHPLYRRIDVLVQSRALDKTWAVYLKQLDKDERQSWWDALARIQKGERSGVCAGLAWFEIMGLRRGMPAKQKAPQMGLSALFWLSIKRGGRAAPGTIQWSRSSKPERRRPCPGVTAY